MTRQSTTPFMKLTEKKRKTVTFDERGALEKTRKDDSTYGQDVYKIRSKRCTL